jgi:hypothetical protein
MSRKIYATLAAALLVGVAVVSVAAASTPGITAPQTLRLVARGGASTFVDNGKTGPSIGDQVILNQPIYWASDPTKLAGRGHVAVLLEGRNVSQDQANVVLSGGQISVQGFQHSGSTFRLAVTGGTGVYSNVRGEAIVTLLSNNNSNITLILTP